MESFSQHIIPALIRLAKSNAGYESYNPETREWSKKVGKSLALGRYLGTTPHYTGYFNEEKNLYSIYPKNSVYNPVAQNMTTADSAVSRWIELEEAAQEGIPMIGMEPVTELPPISTRPSRGYSSREEAKKAWKEWQTEKGKKVMPWRDIGDYDNPKDRYQLIGMTQEELSVPFEEQEVVWRKGDKYRVESKWEREPIGTRIKKTGLTLPELIREVRSSHEKLGQYTTHPIALQVPMEFGKQRVESGRYTSAPYNIPRYKASPSELPKTISERDYIPDTSYNKERIKDEAEEYEMQQRLQRAMLGEETGVVFKPYEYEEPTDEEIRYDVGRQERWERAQEHPEWSPGEIKVYEDLAEEQRRDWLMANVPTGGDVLFSEGSEIVEEPIEVKESKRKIRRRK